MAHPTATIWPSTGTRAQWRNGAAFGLRLARNDLRLAAREPMTLLLLIAPVLLAAVASLALPPLITVLAERGISPVTSRATAIGVLAVAVPVLLGGAIVAVLLVSDRDESTLLALEVTPLGLRGYLAYRGVAAAVFGLTAAVAVLIAVGAPPPALAAAPIVALLAACVAFGIAAAARTTVQSLAMVKVMSLPLLLPVTVSAFATMPATQRPPAVAVLAVSPTWWPVQVVGAGLGGGPVGPAAVSGLAVSAALLVVAWRFAMRRLTG